MIKNLACLLLAVILLGTAAPVGAGTDWTTMEESANIIYQVDKQTVVYSGENPDRTLDVWVKIIEKAKPDVYGLVHFLVREKDFTFMKKEHTMYATSGAAVGSTDSSFKGWGPLPTDSPVGRIAKRLFTEAGGKPSAPAPSVTPAPAPAIVVNPQELKQALEDGRIKEKTNKDGTRGYYVRDRKTPGLFSGDSESITTEFNLTLFANNERSATLYVEVGDSRSGSHAVKETVTLVVDGKQWVLKPPLRSDSSGYSGVSFQMLFAIPGPLYDALLATRSSATIIWQHRYGNNWDERHRIISDKIIHDAQMMYLECK